MGCRAPGRTVKVLLGLPYCGLLWAGLEGKESRKPLKAKETLWFYSILQLYTLFFF